MADASSPVELHEIPYLRLFPWIRLFRAVRVALDAKKLILAALGLALTVTGWSAIELLFPQTGVAELGFIGQPLPSPFSGRTSVAEAVIQAATRVTDPALTLLSPFTALLGLEAAPGAFWHALLASIWAVVVWGLIGGAICRIAVAQVAADERVGLRAALQFSLRKAGPLVGAPLAPFVGVGFFAVLCAILGLFYRIPGAWMRQLLGLLAFLPLFAGLVMAIILLGLAVGWPLMQATIAAEAEDAFDALSRSYAYVYQKPGRYLAYALLAWGIGTIGMLVVGTFAHALVQIAAWSLSFGAPEPLVVALFRGRPIAGSGTHAAWLTATYLLAYGWVYSYFWTAATIIYLLLRHDVDGTDWHDVVLAAPDQIPLGEPLATEPTPAAPPPAPPAPPAATPSVPGEQATAPPPP